ncbi:hypothetical protein ROZALSC1DRAFT_23142 [Rozella allomycis CSF55]|uniref:Uncharacterized protein n=1 Tax=Rozella allomycis (strain CSF55) TaxID=988480 RepID=A0A4P9YHQ2_ROZAC|nr:hypothetical protein ROZALSC1DRAFT_23142 [Rozella allomycis CSF55]
MTDSQTPGQIFFMSGAGFAFTLFNVILIIIRVIIDVKLKSKSNRHWISATFAITIPVYSVTHICAIFNPELLTTSHAVYLLYGLTSITAAIMFVFLATLKYYAIIANPIKRKMVERACVVFNLVSMVILQIWAIIVIVPQSVLPPKYSSALNVNVVLILIQVLQVFGLGPIFFVLKLRNQIKQFESKRQNIKDLLDVVNSMNIGFFIVGAYGIWSSATFTGTIYFAPNVVMTLNLMILVENIGDFMLKYNVNKSKFQTKRRTRAPCKARRNKETITLLINPLIPKCLLSSTLTFGKDAEFW